MDNLDIFSKIILSVVLGAVIGLEREVNEKRNLKAKNTAVLGLRTFSITALLGAISGFIFNYSQVISVVIIAASLLLILVYYLFDTYTSKDIGITTEIALFITFVIGLMIALSVLPVQVIIAITVILIVLLSRKEKIKDFTEVIKKTNSMLLQPMQYWLL
jgi:uncharacterized membrane protein YhiD involved in acid resistance